MQEQTVEVSKLAEEVKSLVGILKGKAGTALTRLDSALINVRAAATQPVSEKVKAQLKTAETDIVKAGEAVKDMAPPTDAVDQKAGAIKDGAAVIAKGADALADTAVVAVKAEAVTAKKLEEVQDDWLGPRTWWWIKFVRNLLFVGIALGGLTFLATTLLPGAGVMTSGLMAGRIGSILRWLGGVLWRIVLAVFHVVTLGGRVLGNKLNAWWDSYYAKRFSTPTNPNAKGTAEVLVRTGSD